MDSSDDLQEVLTHPDLLREFEVRQKLGQGGMGALFVARQKSLDRDVALKFVLRSGAIDLARFNREGLLLSRLAHPNVLKIYAVEMFGRTPTLVLELLKGRTLKDEVAAAGALPVARVRDLGLAILDGLAAAHDLGVIHRDLKTENIFLPEDGGLKILDFGLARESSERKVASITQAGTILGTPAYMSPELCQGHRVDGRSDLYSVGVILFELASGKLPFSGEYPMDLILKHVQEAPPALASIAPGVPEALEEVVRIALSKKPSERFPSAGHFREALSQVPQFRSRATGKSISRPVSRPIRSTLTGSTPPAPGRPLAGNLLLLGGALALAAAGLLVTTLLDLDGRVSKRNPPPAPQSPKGTSSARHARNIDVRVADGRLTVQGLPGDPCVVMYFPEGRPDLARTMVFTGGADHPQEVALAAGAGHGDLTVEVRWQQIGGAPAAFGPVPVRWRIPAEHARRLRALREARGDPGDPVVVGREADALARERVYAASAEIEEHLRALLRSGVGGRVTHLLEALEVLGPERSDSVRALLVDLEPHLAAGRPLQTWARCVAALRLAELAPRIEAHLDERAHEHAPPATAQILGAALAALGGGRGPLERQLGTPESSREALTSLALLADPASGPALVDVLRPDWVDGSKEAVWLRLLAAAELPREACASLVQARWPPPCALIAALAAARHRAHWLTKTDVGAVDPSFEAALARRLVALDPASPADVEHAGRWRDAGEQMLAAVAAGRAGRADTGRLTDAEGIASTLLEAASSHARLDERFLRDTLRAALLRETELPLRTAVDVASTVLWCLGRQPGDWEPATLTAVVDTARGARGGQEADPSAWIRQLRALEALAARVPHGGAVAATARRVVTEAIAAGPGPVRWAALCCLARVDTAAAAAFALPGPGARVSRVDALGVWHRTGLTLRSGDELILAGWGAWRIARREFDWTDADGYEPDVERRSFASTPFGAKLRPERFPRMSLIARVGHHAFRVGRHRRIRVLDDGELLLRPYIPLDGAREEFDSSPALAWLAGLGPGGQPQDWAGLRGFVTVAVERRPATGPVARLAVDDISRQPPATRTASGGATAGTVPGRLSVGIRPEVSKAGIEALVSDSRCTLVRELDLDDAPVILGLQIPAGATVPATVQRLARDPRVRWAEPVYIIPPMTVYHEPPVTLPALVTALGAPEFTARAAAVEALVKRGVTAHPVLALALRDPDPKRRGNAAVALSRIGEEHDASVPGLIACLADKDPVVRRPAAAALYVFGKAAGPAERALESAARDTDPDVAILAWRALVRVRSARTPLPPADLEVRFRTGLPAAEARAIIEGIRCEVIAHSEDTGAFSLKAPPGVAPAELVKRLAERADVDAAR